MSPEIRPEIRDVTDADLAAVLALNQAALPHVSSVGLEDMRRFAGEASRFRIVQEAGHVAGFLIALSPGLAYASDNYRWFCAAYDDFLYIDRIVINEAARGRGLGKVLYGDIIATARTLAPILTCEVNSRPPNPQSMAFHEAFGFAPVGTQATEGGTKEVTLLSLDLKT